MTRAESTCRLLLRLYPRAWRDRYGEEVAGLVEATGLRPRDAVDLLVGAVREQGLATLRGEPRTWLGHLLVVLGLTIVSGIVSRLLFGVAPVYGTPALVASPQYVGLLAIARMVAAVKIRTSSGLRITAPELVLWTVLAVVSGAIVQAPWTGGGGFWVLGRLPKGFNGALNQIGVIYYVLVVMPEWMKKRRAIRPVDLV